MLDACRPYQKLCLTVSRRQSEHSRPNGAEGSLLLFAAGNGLASMRGTILLACAQAKIAGLCASATTPLVWQRWAGRILQASSCVSALNTHSTPFRACDRRL